LPVIPMLLVNGCIGIGTGFSTDIPPYNPQDIINILRERLLKRLPSMECVPLTPWWCGFTGEVVSDGNDGWITKGVYVKDDKKKTFTITELPVGVWTKDYKAFLDDMASVEKVKEGEKIPKSMEYAYTSDGKPLLKGFDDLYTDDVVKFILYFDEDTYEDLKAHPSDFEKRFKLTSTWKTTNMVAFNTEHKITRYDSPGEILEGFYEPRLACYEERRQAEIKRLEAEAIESDAKARFIKAVLDGTMELRRKTDEEIIELMKRHELPPLSGPEEKGVDAWDYLLRLRMDRVKASAVKEAEEKVAQAMGALKELQETTASQLWLKDLKEVETGWEKMLAVRNAEKIPAAAKKKTSGKK
jgi:DNA topoisomerase-2